MSDLIRRQDVLGLFQEAIDSRKKLIWIREHIEELPSAQPERKKGKWIKEGSYKDRWGDTIEMLRCPICEFKHDYSCGDTSKHDDGWFNYCPNCGSYNGGGE